MGAILKNVPAGWTERDRCLSQEVEQYEVTIQTMAWGYRVSVWKGEHKSLYGNQDFKKEEPQPFKRALKLGNTLVKQLKTKG